MTKIRKAIIPIGYVGVNFLQPSEILSNEMLQIVDKPLIQYVIDEARDAGIEEFIFVTGQNKSAVEEYLAQIDLSPTEKTIFIRQPYKQKLTYDQDIVNALLLARDIIGNEAFALLLPGVIIQSKTACLTQLIKAQKDNSDIFKCVLGVQEATSKHSNKHFISVHNIDNKDKYKVTKLDDKGKKPSDLEITERYIFPPEIFDIIAEQKSNSKSKLNLISVIKELLSNMPIMAVKFSGTSFDCQTKAGYIAANISFAIERADIKDELIDEFIRTRLRLKVDNLLDENAIIEMTKALRATSKRQI